MANKIKITEGQLKKLMVLKNKIQENEGTSSELNEFFNSPAPGVVERLKQQITSMVMESIKEEFLPLNFDTLDEGLKAITIDQIFYFLKEGIKKDMGLPNDIDKAKEERDNYENDEPQMPENPSPIGDEDMSTGELPSIRDIDMVNESIVKIKSEFNRFL
jgi:hypothetical protein